MAKFNDHVTIKTVNQEGHAAYAMTDKAKVVTQVLTSFFNEAKFYGDNTADMMDTVRRVIKTDPAFISHLAVYARREFNMRSVSHALVGALAHEPEGKPFVRKTVRGVTLRGDDATEILAYYLNTYGKPIPNSLRKGLKDVFSTFDEYTLAKYKGKGKSVKMRDVLCLCRPTPKDEIQSDLWKRLLEGKLKTPVTWETELSRNGNTKAAWETLIDSGKVGYMAMLRNLRNILKARPDNLNKVYALLEDPEAVRYSRQLPFRFLAAFKSIADIASSRVMGVLENAVEASIENMPKLKGTTVIAVDGSGSMGSGISKKSDILCCEIGMLLGLIANRICENSVFYTFENVIQKFPLSDRNSILYTALRHSVASGGTNMGLPFEKMMEDHVLADRLIIISDNMCNAGSTSWHKKTVQTLADEYRKASSRDIWVHAIDLQGYGTQQFHGPKTNIIAGWSEKVLTFIHLAEAGKGALEKAIAAYEWESGPAD